MILFVAGLTLAFLQPGNLSAQTTFLQLPQSNPFCILLIICIGFCGWMTSVPIFSP